MTLISSELDRHKNTIYAFGSNVSYTLAIWLISVLINYFLGAESLGEYSMVQAILSPVALFFQLQLKVLATIEYDIKGRFSVYQKTILLSETLFILVIFLIGIFTKQPGLFYSFALFKIVEIYYNFIQGYYQSQNNFKYVFYNSAIRGALLFGLIVLGLSFYKSTSFGFIVTNLILVGVILFYDIKNIKKEVPSVFPKASWQDTKELFINGASVSLVAFMDSLMVSIPRYFVKADFNQAELGRFTMVLQFFIAATIFVVSVGHPFLVRLKTHLQNNEKKKFNYEVRKTTLFFLFASVLVIIFFIIFGTFIMRVIWGKENAGLSSDLKLSMIGIVPLFLSSIFIYVINSLQYFKIHIFYYPFVVLAELVFGFLIIPVYGLRGGVLTIIFSQTARMILSGIVFFVVLHRLNKGPDKEIIDHITPAE